MAIMIENTPYNETNNYNKNNNYSNSDCDLGSEYEFTEDEIKVANILLDMPYLITKSFPSYRLPVNWGSKRCRSAVENPPLRPLPPLITSSPHSYCNTSFETEKEELETMVVEKLHNQRDLKQEIGKVRLYLEKVKAENYELKAKKQKLMELENNQKDNDHMHVGPSTSNQFSNQQPSMELGNNQRDNDPVHASPSTSNKFSEQQPSMELGNNPADNDHIQACPSTFNQFRDQEPSMNENQTAPIEEDLNGEQEVNHAVRPTFDFDLNEPAEEEDMTELQLLDQQIVKELQLMDQPKVKESQLLVRQKVNELMPLDHHMVNELQPLDQQMERMMVNRAVKAEARRKRMLIYKTKKLARRR